MRYFSRPSGLERLSLEARILYTGFCVFMALGYVSSAWLYADAGLGTSAEATQRYYLGDEPSDVGRDGVIGGPSGAPSKGASGPALELPTGATGAVTATRTGGPALELPDAAERALVPATAAEGLRFAKAPRQVWETFHFHLFSVPVCLLIIGHIFMLSGLATPVKAWIIAIASVSTLVHVAMPPLVRLASPALAPLMFPSALLMGLTWLFMTLWPIGEMWRAPTKSRERRAQGD
ncbi:hypothetical protein L6R52_24920 [Myxococcota bacterium]|nr:hypothetical protein [Myxococcota bacterium]